MNREREGGGRERGSESETREKEVVCVRGRCEEGGRERCECERGGRERKRGGDWTRSV
jgi:hypothetical protein